MSNRKLDYRGLVYNSRTKTYCGLPDKMMSIINYLSQQVNKQSSYAQIVSQVGVDEGYLRVMAQRLEKHDLAVRFYIKNGRYRIGHLRLDKDVVVLGEVEFIGRNK